MLLYSLKIEVIFRPEGLPWWIKRASLTDGFTEGELRKGFNNPSHGKFPLGGYLPPTKPAQTRFFQKK